MKVIITGGTGLIGSRLARKLDAAGHKVWVLTRDAPHAHVTGNIEAVEWDAQTVAGWGHLASEADAVINLAGENIGAGRWTAKKKERIISSRQHAGQAVVEAVRSASPRPRLVIQSSAVGYYGPSGDEIVTEKTPAGPDWLAHVATRWEDSTRAVEAMGVRRVVTRAGVVLTSQGGILARMALPFRLFVGGPLGSGRQYVAWIHIDDLLSVYQFLLKTDQAAGAYNLTSPEPVTNSQFGHALSRVMRRPYWAPVPGFALRLVLGQMSTLVLDGQRVIPDRLQGLGFKFTYPNIEQALQNLLSKR